MFPNAVLKNPAMWQTINGTVCTRYRSNVLTSMSLLPTRNTSIENHHRHHSHASYNNGDDGFITII